MKILHILSSNKYSGAENVACQIISMFNEDDSFEFAYSSPDGEIRTSLAERGVKFLPLKKMSQRELKRVIKEFAPDVIHAHDIKAICNSLIATKQIPVIGHIHRNHPDFNKKSLRSFIFNYFTKRKNLKKIIWVSNSCFESYIFKNSVKAKSVVLKNIININQLLNLAQNAKEQEKSDLIFIGRLTDVKNPKRLIEIVEIVKKQISNIKMSIIGSGDLLEELKNISIEKSLEKNIKFYGHLENGYGLLKNSKIFLMSSRTEGLPMCILEAQAFGIPVVCTDIVGLDLIVEEDKTGFLYKSNQEAANKIVEYLNNKEKYKNIQENTVKFSKEYNNISKYREKIRQLYNIEI